VAVGGKRSWFFALSDVSAIICLEGDDPSLVIQADHQREALRDAEFPAKAFACNVVTSSLFANSQVVDNRLVDGSSLSGPTTQSPSNRDFPVLYEKPRIGGDSCAHFVSACCRLNFRGLPCKIAFPHGRRPVAVDLVIATTPTALVVARPGSSLG